MKNFRYSLFTKIGWLAWFVRNCVKNYHRISPSVTKILIWPFYAIPVLSRFLSKIETYALSKVLKSPFQNAACEEYKRIHSASGAPSFDHSVYGPNKYVHPSKYMGAPFVEHGVSSSCPQF